MMFYTFGNFIATGLIYLLSATKFQVHLKLLNLSARVDVCPFFLQSRAFLLETGIEQFLPDLWINQNLNTVLFHQALLISVFPARKCTVISRL